MRAGRMDRMIALHTFTAAKNDYGELIETWTPLATVWAERRDLRGKELLEAQQVNATMTCVYRIRYRADVTAKMRIVDGTTTYEIAAPPIEIGRREGLELLASAAVN